MSAVPLSLVVPNLNMGSFLGEALESILVQNYPALDLVVRDGGSTDGSASVAASFGSRVRWISQPDGGPAEALRNGFAEAAGEVLGWLNADDLLEPGSLDALTRALDEHPAAAAAFGEADFIGLDGVRTGSYPVRPGAREELDRNCFICQPACLFRASAYRAAGGLDPRWNCSFDYDLWIRLARRGPFVYVPLLCARQRMHAGAKTLRQRRQVFQEGIALLRRHFGYVPFEWVHSYVNHRLDGRDQVFEPMRDARWRHALSVPLGCWYNRRHPGRFLRDWLSHTRFG